MGSVSVAVGVVNLILGVAYVGYGVMTAIEMKRDWRMLGFSHFGLAWLFMAFTCGPHHLAHGVHVALEGRVGGPLDLFSAVIGIPAAVIWLGLRIEAFTGGRGDRFIHGTPAWLRVAPPAAATYVLVLATAVVLVVVNASHLDFGPFMLVNLVLVALYCAIGLFLLRTQLDNRAPLGGWSLSGVSLTVVFPTCAMMHLVWATYAAQGSYHQDVHGEVIDMLSIPAAVYFLWVVRGLYHDAIRDWNREDQAPEPVPVPIYVAHPVEGFSRPV
jgi:uncharacterized membrane protein SirB2